MAIESIYPEELVIIGLDTPDGEEHPLFDERIHRPLSDSFVANIAFLGVLSPVIVKRDGDRLLVVDGRQRVRASRFVNERRRERGEMCTRVKVVLQKAEERQLAEMVIVTNEHRHDDDFLTKSRKTLRMVQQTNDPEAVAAMFGVTLVTVQNRLRLAEAAHEIHDAVIAGMISPSAAMELARVSGHTGQREALEKVLSVNPTRADGAPAPVSTSAAKAAKRAATGGHKGIRRVWLRKALKTEAGKQLAPEHRAVLEWVIGVEPTADVSGGEPEADATAWFTAFALEAGIELGEGA